MALLGGVKVIMSRRRGVSRRFWIISAWKCMMRDTQTCTLTLISICTILTLRDCLLLRLRLRCSFRLRLTLTVFFSILDVMVLRLALPIFDGAASAVATVVVTLTAVVFARRVVGAGTARRRDGAARSTRRAIAAVAATFTTRGWGGRTTVEAP